MGASGADRQRRRQKKLARQRKKSEVRQGCLGAKNGFGALVSSDEYDDIRDRAFARGRESCDLAFASAIVRRGIAYAESLGFRPHPDVGPALDLLGPEEPCDVEIPLGGLDGRPCYISGPDDDSDYVLRRLTKTLGPDGFRAEAGLGWDDDDEEDDDGETDDDDIIDVEFSDRPDGDGTAESAEGTDSPRN